MGQNRTDLVFLCAVLYRRHADRRNHCLFILKTFAEGKAFVNVPGNAGLSGLRFQEDVTNDALGIAFSGFIGYLAVTVAVHQFAPDGGTVVNMLRYLVLAAFMGAALVYWNVNVLSSIGFQSNLHLRHRQRPTAI